MIVISVRSQYISLYSPLSLGKLGYKSLLQVILFGFKNLVVPAQLKSREPSEGPSGNVVLRIGEGPNSRTRIKPSCASKSVLGLTPCLERHASKSQRRIGHLGGKGTIQVFPKIARAN